MKAAQVTEPNKLEINEVEISDPTGTQVLIKVLSSGICHSDVHLREAALDMGDGEFLKVSDIGVKFPVTPGHEIVGKVEKIGESVKDVQVGDTVLVYPWIGCGQCPICEKGDTNLCESPQGLGVWSDGGYAEQVIVPDYKFLANIGDLDPNAASSLACAGLAAYVGIKKALANNPESILIVGAGGVGLMAVQLANHMGKCNIICADIDDEKLNAAKELGATHIVNTKESDAVQKIMSSCSGKGVDSIVDLVNAPDTVKLAQSVIRKRGTIILVGLFGGAAKLPLVSVPFLALTITYVFVGTFNDMMELMDLAKQGIIKPIISKHYTLNEASDALDDLKNGKILGRAVINP